eukprot:403350235
MEFSNAFIPNQNHSLNVKLEKMTQNLLSSSTIAGDDFDVNMPTEQDDNISEDEDDECSNKLLIKRLAQIETYQSPQNQTLNHKIPVRLLENPLPQKDRSLLSMSNNSYSPPKKVKFVNVSGNISELDIQGINYSGSKYFNQNNYPEDLLNKQQNSPAFVQSNFLSISTRQELPPNKQINAGSGVLNLGNKALINISLYTLAQQSCLKEYEIGDIIAQGNTSESRYVTHIQTGERRILKVINLQNYSKSQQQELICNLEVMMVFEHPNIPKMFMWSLQGHIVYIVVEYIDGGELLDRLISVKQLSEKMVAQIMKQMFSAIKYAAHYGIHHYDIKPENLLLDSKFHMKIKILDFGLNCFMGPQRYVKVKRGSSYYLPPEIIRRQFHKNSDIWSCGVILHILLSGYPPFCGRDEVEILNKIKQGSYSLKAVEWKNITSDGKKLIHKMLQYDAKQRFTVLQCMEDVWFQRQESIRGMGRIITIDCINNLRSFCSEQKLQSAVVNYLANKETNLAMNRELEHIFLQFDVNGDGMLSYNELISGYTQMLGCANRAERQVHEILFKLGQKQLTEIDYHDFLKANVNLEHEVTDIKLKAAFNLFDIDGNGCITLDEIQYLLGGQEDVEEQVWIDLVFAADQDNDGEITFEEFKKMMYVMYLNKEKQRFS